MCAVRRGAGNERAVAGRCDRAEPEVGRIGEARRQLSHNTAALEGVTVDAAAVPGGRRTLVVMRTIPLYGIERKRQHHEAPPLAWRGHAVHHSEGPRPEDK